MQDRLANQALKYLSRRYAPRYALRLPASGADAGASFDVCIRSISATGLAFESSIDLDIGGRAEIDLPGNGSTPVTVIWRNGQLSGCTFDVPINRSVVTATRLKGYPVPAETAAAVSAQASVDLTGHINRWPGATRVYVAIGAGLLVWALVLGPIALLA